MRLKQVEVKVPVKRRRCSFMFLFPFIAQWLQADCMDCFIRSLADPTVRANIAEGLRAGQNGIQSANRILTDDQIFLMIKLGLREFVNQKFITLDEFNEFLTSPDGIEKFGVQLDAANPIMVHSSWLVNYYDDNT